jgi:hypothetical protein
MKIEEQRILAGSLNLLTPSDKTPENDCIDLRNVRVDQADVLRGADSFLKLATVGNGAAAVHTIFRLGDLSVTQTYGVGNQRVSFGEGTSGPGAGLDGAYFIGAGASLYFYWPGGASGAGSLTTLVNGTLSGNPLSLVAWNSFLWLLDPLQQLKINPALLMSGGAAAVTVWLPALPTAVINAQDAGSTLNGTLVGTFDYYCTYVRILPGNTIWREGPPSPVLAVTAKGGGVAITGIPYVATVQDYNTPSVTYPVDAIRVYRAPTGTPFYSPLTRPSAGNPNPPGSAMQFLVQFGLGATCISNQTGGYVQSTLPLTATYPSASNPVNPYIDSAAVLTGDVTNSTQYQLGPEPLTDYILSNPSGFPAAPLHGITAVAGFDVSDSAGMVGAYSYYLTYVNSAGLETNPSTEGSVAQTPSAGVLNLAWAAPPAGQDIVLQRLYRLGGTLGSAYQLAGPNGTGNIPITTLSTVDSAPDASLTEFGIFMPTLNDPPPSGLASDSMGLVGPYFNVLMAWQNSRLFWSQNGVPLFPGSGDAAIGNWVNVGAPDDTIQVITLHPQLAAIYKQKCIWRLLGDPVSGALVNSAATCGTLGKQAVANCGTYDMFQAPDGVYSFNMDANLLASEKIAPVFMGKQWIGLGARDLTQPTWGAAQNPFSAFLNGTLILGNGGAFLNDPAGAALLFHPGSQRWAAFNSSNPGSAPLTAALPNGNQYRWFAGDAAGNLFLSQQVAGSANLLIWQTRFLDQGVGDEPKHYQEIVIDAELNGGTMTVWLLFDDTTDVGLLNTILAPYTATFSGTNRQKFYMPLPQDEGDTGQYHISVRMQILPLAGAVPPAVHWLYIYWATEERDASIRGTQVLDFRDERIQLCQRMEVDSVGPVAIAIWTDEPTALAQRYSFSTTSSARIVSEFPLPPTLRGRLWRVDVQPTNKTARVYAVRGWMRQVGTAQTEQWQWKDFLRGVDAELPDAE